MYRKTPTAVERTAIFHIPFYEKKPFYGSLREMRYRIEKFAEENGENRLRVITWPGPYNFDTTDDSLKETKLFPYSEEGLDAAVEYLNRLYAERYRRTV